MLYELLKKTRHSKTLKSFLLFNFFCCWNCVQIIKHFNSDNVIWTTITALISLWSWFKLHYMDTFTHRTNKAASQTASIFSVHLKNFDTNRKPIFTRPNSTLVLAVEELIKYSERSHCCHVAHVAVLMASRHNGLVEGAFTAKQIRPQCITGNVYQRRIPGKCGKAAQWSWRPITRRLKYIPVIKLSSRVKEGSDARISWDPVKCWGQSLKWSNKNSESWDYKFAPEF